MAVITCLSCSAKVNEGASACPECGADPRTGESLVDWSRLTPSNSEATVAEAQKTRASALPIGLCIAGGIWALLVWAAGSLVAAMIGVEGADPHPPRHVGLLLLLLAYVVAAGLALWAAARTPSNPRSGRNLALAAFGLGYVPAAAAALIWDLLEPSRLGYEVLVSFLVLLWTLGGWTLAFAAILAWRRARLVGRGISEPASSDTAAVMASIGVCTAFVLAFAALTRGSINAHPDAMNAVSSPALPWALAGGVGLAGGALLRRRRVPGVILLGVAAAAGFVAVASAPPRLPYNGGRPELLATWAMAALPFLLAIAIELSERSGSRRGVDWRFGAGVVLACVGAFVAIWLRPEVARQAIEASSAFWHRSPDAVEVVTFATARGGLLVAATLAFVGAAVCYWRPLEGAVAAGAAAVVGLAGIIAQQYPSVEVWRPDVVQPRWAWDFVWLWSLGMLALGLSAAFSYLRWRPPAQPEAILTASGQQVEGNGATGTLSHTTATTSSRGDDVHDDHDHQTPGAGLEPGVDAGSGRLEEHCSQCGSLIEGSHEFCQVCALEASGGELPPEADSV
jgi:RNA polymerase subunit RPABC4/transcription elongation factor Spt4